MARKFWWDYNMHHMPLGFFRSVLKQQFVKNSHLQDIRVIDRLVGECRQVGREYTTERNLNIPVSKIIIFTFIA